MRPMKSRYLIPGYRKAEQNRPTLQIESPIHYKYNYVLHCECKTALDKRTKFIDIITFAKKVKSQKYWT